MSFDTTGSNSGSSLGATVGLQKQMALERSILFLACRHHLSELIVSCMFDAGLSPDFKIFAVIKDAWESFDTYSEAKVLTLQLGMVEKKDLVDVSGRTGGTR